MSAQPSGETVPRHHGFSWLRTGHPKIGEWYDDGSTFEPASHDWKTSGPTVNVYAFDPSDLLEHLDDLVERWQPPEGFTVWLDEARVLQERLDEVTVERDFLRRVVERLVAPSGPGGGSQS